MQSIIKDKISVIGLGKLGLPLSTLFAKNDVFVMGVDTNKDLVDKLNKKRIPFFETDLEKNLKLAHSNIEYTTSYNGIVEETDISIILVNTQIGDGYSSFIVKNVRHL